jgi:hypothetical protein
VAAHDTAFVLAHVKLADCPAVIEVGIAAMDTVGAGCGVTVTVVLSLALPSSPLHERVYVVVVVGVMAVLPLIGSLPLHPPEAVHELTLLPDHVKVDD